MSDNVSVEELLEELSEIVEKAWNFPLGRGRAMLDVEEVREAETIVRVAEERARAMVNQDEIVRQAQQKANEMLAQAQTRFREMRKASNEYIDDLMRRTDEGLAANLAELRKTRQEIKSTLRSGQN